MATITELNCGKHCPFFHFKVYITFIKRKRIATVQLFHSSCNAQCKTTVGSASYQSLPGYRTGQHTLSLRYQYVPTSCRGFYDSIFNNLSSLPALRESLESRGVLGQLKARIRAEVFNALDDQSEPRPALSHDNLLINELIREYLEFNKYRYTASVLTAGEYYAFNSTIWQSISELNISAIGRFTVIQLQVGSYDLIKSMFFRIRSTWGTNWQTVHGEWAESGGGPQFQICVSLSRNYS